MNSSMLIANNKELAFRLTEILTKSKKILHKAKKLTNLGTDFFAEQICVCFHFFQKAKLV